jgi:hypothetical protein
MYKIDDQDEVVELKVFPPSDVGAPFPIILANESKCVLGYEIEPEEEWAIVTLSAQATYFGGPSDEAINGHPLYERGLRSYSVFEVQNSSWIREMEVRNRVHHQHDASNFSDLRHIIFTFHDSIVESVVSAVSWEQWNGECSGIIHEMARRWHEP